MKKLLLTFAAIFASVGMYAQSPGMLLRHTEVIGDPMGEQQGIITQWTKPLYDKEGKVIRETVYGTGLDGKIEITRYTTNEYDSQGQLIRKSSQQYGLFDGTDLAFRAVSDTTVYSYDAKGNLVFEETQEYEQKKYTYDNDGNLVKKERFSYSVSNWNLSETTEYSDFVNGQPTKLNNTGQWESYNYVGEMEYDANGNKIKELHYNNWSDKNLVGNSFYWTYDADGFLSLYEKKYVSNGEERDQLRTVYTKLPGATDSRERIASKTQTYSSGNWYNEATSLVREYAKYNHADYAPEMTADKVGDENRIKIDITLPKRAAETTLSSGIKLTDNGIVLAILPTSEYSSDGKTISYTTEILKNGNHEILAQYVEQENGAGSWTETSTIDWNVSAPVMVQLDKQLPAASNIRGVAADKDKNGMFSLTIKWDAAPNADAYGLIRYNVMVERYSVPDNFEDSDKCLDLTWTLTNLDGSPVTLMIQAVYPYGKSNTEYVTINPKEFLQIVDDNRICVEEECTYVAGNTMGVSAGAKTVTKYFVNADDVVTRSALYDAKDDGSLELAQYDKYIYEGSQLTLENESGQTVIEQTFTEQGKLASQTYDKTEEGSKYQYVKTFKYSERDGRLESETIKRAKYKSTGSLGASSVYAQTIYTNDSENEGIVNGVFSTYDAMKAKWTECYNTKRYMISAGSNYSPKASALSVDGNSVTISAMPQEEWQNGLAAFSIYRDGEVIAKGLSFFDEAYLKQSEYGEFLDWNYTDLAPENKSECEYIVQYVTLDNYLNYDRAYASSEPFVVKLSGASGIASIHSESNIPNSAFTYNLAGQKVDASYRGIVILGGKKVLVK